MQKTGLHIVDNLRKRWMATYLVETVLLSLAIASITLLISTWILQSQSHMISLSILLISLPVLFFLRGYEKISIPNVLRLLSIQNDDLQYSAELIAQDSLSLTKLEQLQKSRIDNILVSSKIKFTIPNKIKMILAVMALCFGALALSTYWNNSNIEAKNVGIAIDRSRETVSIPMERGIKSLNLKISPPTYTNQKERTQESWDILATEGANMRWNLTFHEYVEQVTIRFSDNTELPLTQAGNRFSASAKAENRTLYELVYTDSIGNRIYSDFHKLDIIYDTPPQVEVRGIAQFSEHEFGGNNKFDLQVSLADDYGVSDAYIIATIAQGSGESVMFREEKIKFDTQIKPNTTKTTVPKHLDLATFGMGPGDELYFYIEAKDNCTLKNNVTRTQTYILSIRDTSTYASDLDGGLGVDLMPEYFRSQRQIIIDTEKLLKNKPNIVLRDFNATSNELGFDQKALRLKYGQFLGEENESGIAIEDHEVEQEETASTEEGGKEQDALDGFKHDHDHEDEHERANDGQTQEDPLEDYQHAHDSEEIATFFTNTLKGKLKAAMALMWDAELYLRIYEPKKSLPYQYKALKLIKEIKNHARVYVHRIGFDPPPIREESRLSADLSEVKNNRLRSYDTLKDNQAIREVISLINNHIHSSEKYKIPDGDALQQAGIELAQIAIDNPSKYIYGLQILRNWINGEVLDRESLALLQSELIKSLPEKKSKFEGKTTNINPLAKTYLQVLEEKKKAYDR